MQKIDFWTERVWTEIASISEVRCIWFSYRTITIAVPQAGIDCFANQQFLEGDKIGYYYSSRIYQFTLNLLIARGVDGEDAMADTRKELHRSAIGLLEEVFISDKKLNTVLSIPERSVFLRFVNDPWFLSREVLLADKRRKEARS